MDFLENREQKSPEQINILLWNYGGQLGFPLYIAQLLTTKKEFKKNFKILKNPPKPNKQKRKSKTKTFQYISLDEKFTETIIYFSFCVRRVLLHTLAFSLSVCTLLTVSHNKVLAWRRVYFTWFKKWFVD